MAGGIAGRGADLLAAAAALRWARPDLTAELAGHVLEEASAAGNEERWLAAAGWAVHARSATGDGREIACDMLAGLSRWHGWALAQPAARRLRVELAMVAAGAGEVESARKLLAPVVVDDGDPELLADLLSARARCAVEDAPDDVADAVVAAAEAWAAVQGPAAEIGAASVALISAVVERRARRPALAVDHAVHGLSRLERGRGGAATPSAHLEVALAAEWISALLDAGRGTEARDGCSALLPRLSERARPTRQLALLRLTVARAVATGDTATGTVQLLEQAAEDAAGSDVPNLESVCRTALGALHEKAERLDVALESLQRGVTAERRDRARSRRFAAALADLPDEPAPARSPAPRELIDSVTESETTTVLPMITRGDRKLARSRWEELLRAENRGEPRADQAAGEGERSPARSMTPARSRFERMLAGEPEGAEDGGPEQRDADEEPASGRRAGSRTGSVGDSPISDLLTRGLRAAERLGGSASEPRNGKARRARGGDDQAGESPRRSTGRRRSAARPEDEPAASPSGWMPAIGSSRSDERPAHRRTGGARSRDEDAEAAPGADSGPREPVVARFPQTDGVSRDDEPLGRAPEERSSRSDRAGRRRRERGDADASVRARRKEAAEERTARRARDENTGSHADPGSTPPSQAGESEGSAPRNGHRHRADDPWATGRWTVRPAGRNGAESGLADRGSVGRGGADRSTTERTSADHDTTERSSTTARRATERSTTDRSTTGRSATGRSATGRRTTDRSTTDRGAVREPPVADRSTGKSESDGWLEAALADLDRALGSIGSAVRSAPEPKSDDDGCTVVIDIARDARRFAGPRAGAVVRSVADRLSDRLPPEARQRFGDSDTLLISGPGWNRAEATAWMHRTLPDLLDGFVAPEDLPGAQLRVAVHDIDGPVGAQILQNLARSPTRRGEDQAADRAGDENGTAEPDRSGWPWPGRDRPGDAEERRTDDADDEPTRRRHRAVGSAGRGLGEESRGARTDAGRGERAGGASTTTRSSGREQGAEPAENLGIADLLAGALAAYRGI